MKNTCVGCLSNAELQRHHPHLRSHFEHLHPLRPRLRLRGHRPQHLHDRRPLRDGRGNHLLSRTMRDLHRTSDVRRRSKRRQQAQPVLLDATCNDALVTKRAISSWSGTVGQLQVGTGPTQTKFGPATFRSSVSRRRDCQLNRLLDSVCRRGTVAIRNMTFLLSASIGVKATGGTLTLQPSLSIAAKVAASFSAEPPSISKTLRSPTTALDPKERSGASTSARPAQEANSISSLSRTTSR